MDELNCVYCGVITMKYRFLLNACVISPYPCSNFILSCRCQTNSKCHRWPEHWDITSPSGFRFRQRRWHRPSGKLHRKVKHHASISLVNQTLPGVFDPSTITPNVSVTLAECGLFYILILLTEKLIHDQIRRERLASCFCEGKKTVWSVTFGQSFVLFASLCCVCSKQEHTVR